MSSNNLFKGQARKISNILFAMLRLSGLETFFLCLYDNDRQAHGLVVFGPPPPPKKKTRYSRRQTESYITYITGVNIVLSLQIECCTN